MFEEKSVKKSEPLIFNVMKLNWSYGNKNTHVYKQKGGNNDIKQNNVPLTDDSQQIYLVTVLNTTEVIKSELKQKNNRTNSFSTSSFILPNQKLLDLVFQLIQNRETFPNFFFLVLVGREFQWFVGYDENIVVKV